MKKTLIAFSLILMLTLTGCLTQRSLLTPITINFPNYFTEKNIQQAIYKGSTNANWQITGIKDNKIQLHYSWGGTRHQIYLNAIIKKNICTLEYFESVGLNYRESLWSENLSIHKKYNFYIKQLKTSIEKAIHSIYIIYDNQDAKQKYNSYINKNCSVLFDNFGIPEITHEDGQGGKIYGFQENVLNTPGQSKTKINVNAFGGSGFYSGNSGFGSGINATTYKGNTNTTHYAGTKTIHFILFFVDKNGTVYKWQDDIKEI